MKFRILYLAVFLFVCVGHVSAQQKGPLLKYDSYCNSRFDYCISYPIGVLMPQPEADNGDGRKFLTRDGLTEMMVWGQENVLDLTAADLYKEELAPEQGKTLTYKVLKKTWFVVSGTKDGQVFYRKTFFRDGRFFTFTISYPEAKKASFDFVAAKIAASFK